MNKIFKKIILISSILIFTQSLMASEESELKQHIYTKLGIIQKLVNSGYEKEQLHTEIIKVLTNIFDFELMAKLSLGKTQWKEMSLAKRARFVALYTKRMKNSYSSKLDSYKNQKIDIYSTTKKKNRILLKTNIKSNEQILSVNYKFYKPKKQKQNKDEWLIYDVEIEGVSILKADKAQFKDFLKIKNIDELMEALQEQI